MANRSKHADAVRNPAPLSQIDRVFTTCGLTSAEQFHRNVIARDSTAIDQFADRAEQRKRGSVLVKLSRVDDTKHIPPTGLRLKIPALPLGSVVSVRDRDKLFHRTLGVKMPQELRVRIGDAHNRVGPAYDPAFDTRLDFLRCSSGRLGPRVAEVNCPGEAGQSSKAETDEMIAPIRSGRENVLNFATTDDA